MLKIEGVLYVDKDIITFYEGKLKEQVMLGLFSDGKSLKEAVIEHIENDIQQYKAINYAYLNVKRELIG